MGTILHCTEHIFDLENTGIINSKMHTYLVTHFSVKVCHLLAMCLILWGNFLKYVSVMNAILPATPLSRWVWYHILVLSPALFDGWLMMTEAIVLLITLPATTLSTCSCVCSKFYNLNWHTRQMFLMIRMSYIYISVFFYWRCSAHNPSR